MTATKGGGDASSKCIMVNQSATIPCHSAIRSRGCFTRTGVMMRGCALFPVVIFFLLASTAGGSTSTSTSTSTSATRDSSTSTSSHEGGGTLALTSTESKAAGFKLQSPADHHDAGKTLQRLGADALSLSASSKVVSPLQSLRRDDGDDDGGDEDGGVTGGKRSSWSEVRRRMEALMQLPSQVAPPPANASRLPRLAFGIHGERPCCHQGDACQAGTL